MKYSLIKMSKVKPQQVGSFLKDDMSFIAPDFNLKETMLIEIEDWTSAELTNLPDYLPDSKHTALILNTNCDIAAFQEEIPGAVNFIKSLGFKDVTEQVGYESRMAFIK